MEILLARRHTLVAQNCQASVRLRHWYVFLWNTDCKSDSLLFMSTYLKWKVSYLSIFFKSDFNIFMFSVEIAIKCISIWLRLKNGKNVIHIPLVKCRFYISCLFYPILFMKPINKLVRTGTNEKPIATPSIWFKNATIKSKICFRDCFFLNCDSLHARLNSHHEAWSYKKKKHKKITAYRKSV